MTDDLVAALSAWADHPGPQTTADVYAALVRASVLLPVRATVVKEEVVAATGLLAEKESELAVLTITVGDPSEDRRVLPLFTSPDAMRRWRIEARPVAATVRDACQGALEQGWQGIVIDPGTASFVVGAAAVRALAGGFVPVAGQESMSVGFGPLSDPVGSDAEAVASLPESARQSLRRALAREPAVAAAWLIRVDPGDGDAGPRLHLGLALRTPVDQAGLAVIAQRLGGRLDQGPTAGGLVVAVLDPASRERVAGTCLQLWP